jgi:hypothetical protein
MIRGPQLATGRATDSVRSCRRCGRSGSCLQPARVSGPDAGPLCRAAALFIGCHDASGEFLAQDLTVEVTDGSFGAALREAVNRTCGTSMTGEKLPAASRDSGTARRQPGWIARWRVAADADHRLGGRCTRATSRTTASHEEWSAHRLNPEPGSPSLDSYAVIDIPRLARTECPVLGPLAGSVHALSCGHREADGADDRFSACWGWPG